MLSIPIDMIFRGRGANVNLIFLKELLENSKEIRFDAPEEISFESYEEIISIFKSNDYVDFVIMTDYLKIGKKIVKYVFVNLGLYEQEIELLFFFDLKDLCEPDFKKAIDLLIIWANKFKNKYGFEEFVCQMDNGDKNEYYFNTCGLGPLYHIIKN